MESKFLTELETRDLDEDSNFVLLSPLKYYSRLLGGVIAAERGFISDLASTPRVPIVYWFYGNRAHREGVIHDFIYRSPNHEILITPLEGEPFKRIVSKREADSVFLEAMEARGKGWFMRRPMWLGVKFGGFSSYRTGPTRFKIMDL